MIKIVSPRYEDILFSISVAKTHMPGLAVSRDVQERHIL